MTGFTFDAQRYRETSAPQHEWGQRLIAELRLRGDERVLDVGSGDGSLTKKLAAAVPRGSVLGIDASTTMVDAAKPLESANLRFRLLDVLEGDFENEFDVVFSNATLHYVLDHGRLFAVLYRAAKPDAVVRLNFAGDGNCSHLIAVIREFMASEEYRGAFEGFRWPWFMPTLRQYEQLLRESPFRDFEVWLENADRFFPNADAIIGWIDQPSLVPFQQHLDARTAQRFRDAVVQRMLRRTRQPDGRCFETFRRINVLARKAAAV